MKEIDNKQMWEDIMQVITEWSKQDPDNFEHLSTLCTVIQVALERQGFSVNKDYEIVTPKPHKLKSIHPQSHWKPSEEQMIALYNALIDTKGRAFYMSLSELYEQLKEL